MPSGTVKKSQTSILLGFILSWHGVVTAARTSAVWCEYKVWLLPDALQFQPLLNSRLLH